MKKILTSVVLLTVGALAFAQTADPNNFQMTIGAGQTVTLDPAQTYKLTGAVVVQNGGQLIIPAGTKILGLNGTSSYVAVAQGGKIFSNGTATNPVIFSSASSTPAKADWAGIVICGKAPINVGATATSEVASLTYGGTDVADNSGSITYTQINWAGARFSATKEYNGLSLFGVGNGTTIDGVSVINGADDGIEFFGGTVNASKIVSINNDDDAFDWTEGWNGTVTDLYTRRTAETVGNRGIEADNNSSNHTASPTSSPTLKNVSLIGYKTTDSEGNSSNLFRVGTKGTMDNVIFAGWTTAIAIESDASMAWFNGNGKFTNVKFVDITNKATTKTTSGTSATALPGTYTENENATGAGEGLFLPTWAQGWAGYDQFLGTSDVVKKSSLKITPSVATDFIQIHSAAKVTGVEIIDMNGRSILKANNATTVNVSTLAKGVYFVTASNAKGEKEVAKFIKK